MHLAIHNWMRIEPLEHTAARLKRCGYRAVELRGEPELYARPAEVRRTLDEYGIECWGAVTIMTPGRNLLAADEAERAATVQYVKDVVSLVSELDGKVVSVVPGTVGKVEPDADPETEWRWAVESLQDVYGHAQARGVRLAIEPLNRFETYFINRGEQAVALADATGTECGVCLDTFHTNIEEADVIAAIRAAGARLLDFHVAENNRMPPGMGQLDWNGIFEALHEIGYDDAITVEFVTPVDRTPVNHFPDMLEGDMGEMSDTDRKFIEDHGGNVVAEEFYTRMVEQSATALTPFLTNGRREEA